MADMKEFQLVAWMEFWKVEMKDGRWAARLVEL